MRYSDETVRVVRDALSSAAGAEVSAEDVRAFLAELELRDFLVAEVYKISEFKTAEDV